MTTVKTKFNVGIFVIVGTMVLFGALLWFGLSDYLEKGKFYAAYFDESVQGLDKDSSVKYRGVSIGRVESIDVAPDNTLIRVVLKINKEMQLEKDMVAQLKSVGITGIMFVDLDTKRKEDPDLSPAIGFEPKLPVVATKPSEFKKYMDAIEDVLNQLTALDVKGISDRAKSTLDTINSAVNVVRIEEISEKIRSSFARMEEILDPAQWKNVMESIETAGDSLDSLIVNVNGTVSHINQAFVRFDKVVAENEAGLAKAVEGFSISMERAGTLFSEGGDLVQKTEQNLEGLQQHLMVTLQNLEQASRELNRSMERIADQPSLLIFSKPLPEKTAVNSGNP
jgi:phospholipid/cholesterol/gamma-HCH transport system substrate-binding protein